MTRSPHCGPTILRMLYRISPKFDGNMDDLEFGEA
jgi:hypothetical protein